MWDSPGIGLSVRHFDMLVPSSFTFHFSSVVSLLPVCIITLSNPVLVFFIVFKCRLELLGNSNFFNCVPWLWHMLLYNPTFVSLSDLFKRRIRQNIRVFSIHSGCRNFLLCIGLALQILLPPFQSRNQISQNKQI